MKTDSQKLDHLIGLAKSASQDLYILKLQGRINMALGQDILDAVESETTVIDSFIALVQGLIDNNTIPPAVGAQILSEIAGNKAKLNAAIVANTPPVV